MLGEVAITPDVFMEHSYSTPGTSGLHLQVLKEPLLREALVRNLHGGDWVNAVRDAKERLVPRGKELLKKLASQNRLRLANAISPDLPSDDLAWCEEALASNRVDPLSIVITSRNTKNSHTTEQLAVCIEDLLGSLWWASRSPSLRLRRATADYQQHLGRILQSAKSLMFLDPHLDPSRRNYGEFFELLRCCERKDIPPLVELHRVCYVGHGATRQIYSNSELEDMFRMHLKPLISGCSFSVEVFVWDHFHNRYLITDLVGIQLPDGIDISNDINNTTTWTRLGPTHRDDIQREFDKSSSPHQLRHHFVL